MMKKAGLVLLAVFLIITTPSSGQEKNKEVMVKKIFAVLAEKDEEGFVNLFPDALSLKAYMIKAFKIDTTDKDNVETKAFLDSMDDESMQQEFREDFLKFIRMGEDKGVDWLNAKFNSYLADSILVDEDGANTPMLKGKIYFDIGSVKYFLSYNQVIWFENKGWYGVNIDRVDLVTRENEADVYDWDGKVVDSALFVMDSVVSATIADSAMTKISEELPEIKKKTDKQQPEKNKSPKKKSKSPIRKPE